MDGTGGTRHFRRMSPSSLIRTARFRARHRYGRTGWTEEENRRSFGALAEPHEHEWVVEVQVGGPLDEESGFLVDLEALDAVLEEVLGPLRGSDLNEAIPEVRNGGMVPSTEGLARWLFLRVADRVPPPARLERVKVAESETLSAEYRPSSP
jgi:6-pyruvoyltetrahydropterin/6-carboxytetrahydropterin synthase